jgi:hypothetical protein
MADPAGAAGVVKEGGFPEQDRPPSKRRIVRVHDRRVHDLQQPAGGRLGFGQLVAIPGSHCKHLLHFAQQQ